MGDSLGLNNCDREMIHIPGSIQPHGMMLVTDRTTLRIRQVAGNIEGRLGVADWAGRGLADLIGDQLAAQVAVANTGRYAGVLRTNIGESLDVSVFPSGDEMIVELEPASSDDQSLPLALDRLINAAADLERAVSLAAVCDRAAVEFRRLTGYDRVMIYRMLDDDAGRVVAEDCNEGMSSFLDHHFPAADIPQQARALYLRNLIRVIPDIVYTPAVLRPARDVARPLDMSDSALRSVSPLHLQYLANMGIQASMSVSIVKDGKLWGMVACHNATPRMVGYEVRAACRALVGSLALQISAKEAAAGYRETIRLRSFEDDLVRRLSWELAFDDMLSSHLTELGAMLGGDGVAVLRDGELITSGICPPTRAVRELCAWLVTHTSEPVFASSNLKASYPAALEFQKVGSGVLAVILSAEEPWIMVWFRREQIETLRWAGNPHKDAYDANADLTPRKSFDAWHETVDAHSRNWSPQAFAAVARLRHALLDIRQNRRVRDLNRQLVDMLSEKDTLLEQNAFLIGEINHRVQNSLQLVSSFLVMQARNSDSTELHAAMKEAQKRITAVSLVHRRLHHGDHADSIDVARYLEELAGDTITSMGEEWRPHLSLATIPVILTMDQAIPLGLVLTELMININKYAYDGAPGPIAIRLVDHGGGLELVVSDRGRGQDVRSKSGFGWRMIDALVNQLGGELFLGDNRPGLRVTLTAPLKTASVPKVPALT